MKQLIIVLNLLFLTNMSFGQDNLSTDREPFTLKLAIDSLNFYNMEVKSTPYVCQIIQYKSILGKKFSLKLYLKEKN